MIKIITLSLLLSVVLAVPTTTMKSTYEIVDTRDENEYDVIPVYDVPPPPGPPPIYIWHSDDGLIEEINAMAELPIKELGLEESKKFVYELSDELTPPKL